MWHPTPCFWLVPPSQFFCLQWAYLQFIAHSFCNLFVLIFSMLLLIYIFAQSRAVFFYIVSSSITSITVSLLFPSLFSPHHIPSFFSLLVCAFLLKICDLLPANDGVCSQNEFACFSGECVGLDKRCDENNDCRDGSDERGCPPG